MRYRSPRWLLVAALLSLGALGLGCDASGSTQGGTPVIADPCSAANLSPTWTTLYTCYFGPTGKAGCSGKTSCHGAPPPCADGGYCLSGTIVWTCGPTRESCWQGMTQPQYFCPDAGSPPASSDAAAESGPPDAAAESAATDAQVSVEAGADSGAAEAGGSMSMCQTLAAPVPSGSSSDPTTTLLWQSLRGAPSQIGQHDMPYTPSSFVFSQQDLDLISTWIRNGAQDN